MNKRKDKNNSAIPLHNINNKNFLFFFFGLFYNIYIRRMWRA